MTKFDMPQFGMLQLGSWIIIIGIWIGIAYFAWKFFMENPMTKTGKDKKKPESDRRPSLPPSS